MLTRRTLPLGLGVAAALGLGSSALLAQTAPQAAPAAPTPGPAAPAPAAPEQDRIHFTFGPHFGLGYRVGPLDPEPLARGAGFVGVDALIGTNKWYAVGLGYDHGFVGRDRDDNRAGRFFEVNHKLDSLWALGRFYPWQNDEVALFLQLGVGPTWQLVNVSGEVSATGPNGNVELDPSSCSGRTPGFGAKGSVGVDVALSNSLIFFGDVGVDHYRMTGKQINNCGPGLGPSTFLTTRFGLALAVNRAKEKAPPPPPPPPSDRDGDAILDSADACPDQPGLPSTDPTKNGCPPPSDRDRDGIPDAADACPDQAGPPSDDPKKNGCPDRDGDKIIDSLDACPDVPGRPSEDPKENGCPPDTDGDGIRDDKDACPNEKGMPNEDPRKNGCPLVVVREQEIVISQEVQFEVDSAKIKKESNELLDTVAKVMKDHPEITKIEVQGHTDDTGNRQHNKILSGQRAESVKRALVNRGVAEKRLVAQGYGQEKPIADNATDTGKARNRRVQFVILEKKK
jgi:outer membrane protein OmpA-like peptidoglycan-associated protein